MSHLRKLAILSGLAAAAVVLTGCVVAPAPYYQSRVAVVQPGVSVSANVEYVQTAPPAEQTEVVTVSPGAGYVWTPGLWFGQAAGTFGALAFGLVHPLATVHGIVAAGIKHQVVVGITAVVTGADILRY